MKPPGWVVQVGKGELAPDGRGVIFRFRLRWWHPGLWLALARHWWTTR